MKRKRIPLEREFATDKATLEWLKSQKKSTKKVYKSLWRWFLEFTEMNGEQILESRKQDKTHEWENKVLEFRVWASKHTCKDHENPLSEGGIKTATGIIRGFFNYHYSDLKFRRSVSKRLSKKPKRKREDYKLSKETIARMSVVADIRDRYVLVVGKSLGLRAIDFISLKVGDFTCLNLDATAPIALGEKHTVKEGIPAFSFLDSDAVPIVKAYLATIDISDPNARMLQVKKNELTVILQRLAEKANIELGNKHLRFHCLRKFLIDRLSAVMSESKWKQVVGKTISEGAYVSEAQLKDAYAKAMPETTFSNHNRSVMKFQELEQALTRLAQDNEAYKTTIAVLTRKINDLDKEVMQKLKQMARMALTPEKRREYESLTEINS
ncbi:MAG: hypothetical protein OEZ35_08725, partial [Candidatus Bathyarchaeota archaeon]|nr:hypothetical protein [Candidatus Bathyarchaeota archaeon]